MKIIVDAAEQALRELLQDKSNAELVERSYAALELFVTAVQPNTPALALLQAVDLLRLTLAHAVLCTPSSDPRMSNLDAIYANPLFTGLSAMRHALDTGVTKGVVQDQVTGALRLIDMPVTDELRARIELDYERVVKQLSPELAMAAISSAKGAPDNN